MQVSCSSRQAGMRNIPSGAMIVDWELTEEHLFMKN